jgi:hypothetical protein
LASTDDSTGRSLIAKYQLIEILVGGLGLDTFIVGPSGVMDTVNGANPEGRRNSLVIAPGGSVNTILNIQSVTRPGGLGSSNAFNSALTATTEDLTVVDWAAYSVALNLYDVSGDGVLLPEDQRTDSLAMLGIRRAMASVFGPRWGTTSALNGEPSQRSLTSND